MQETIAPAFLHCAKVVKQYIIPATQFQECIEKLRASLSNIATILSISQTAEKLAERYLAAKEIVERMISQCTLNDNHVFYQSWMR